MNATQQQPVLLSDYRKPAYTTRSVQLHFDIRDGETVVTSELQVERLDANGDTLQLDGQELELLSVEVDGRPLAPNEYQVDDEQLQIFGLAAEHTVRTQVKIHPEQNTALEGLYKSSQMYCTQCEAQGFRKITYFQDRPDVLVKFRTTLVADDTRYPNLLSNGNLVETSTAADGRAVVTWEDPFPKPSYLFALVAGNLEVLEDEFVTRSGRRVKLQIFSEAHNIGQCAYAMDALKRSMAWDEERFGREYDLDIFMVVAVEDFNMGAMENKGLNIFNTSCVLASPDTATDAAYQRVEAVVAHEYFHNWSGNRVTCRDWFQLSLKEGFTVFRDAEFSSDMNSRAVKRIEDVSFLRSVQFAEDGGPLAHPVRPQSYLEISNFYTTTIYEKGAEVVRMYQTLLGDDAFREGCDLYFERHDGEAATTDDFTAAMAQAGEKELIQFKRWYDQAGTPELLVTESQTESGYTLRISQSCPPTPGQTEKLPFVVPVLLKFWSESGEVLNALNMGLAVEEPASASLSERGNGEVLLEMLAEQCVLQLPVQQKPLVSFLREFSAPVRVNFERPATDLSSLVQNDDDGFVRWDAMQSLWLNPFENPDADTAPLVELVGTLLEQTLPALGDGQQSLLNASVLSVPDENYLFEALTGFEVDQVLDRRESLIQETGAAHLGRWRELLEACFDGRPYAPGGIGPDSEGMGRRALGQVALRYLGENLPVDELDALITRLYDEADNLTVRRAVLAQACANARISNSVRSFVIDDFYQRWHSEALVLDQWFSLQAQSPLSSVEELTALVNHEKFDTRNPNRVRSVYGAFGMYNNRRLHNLDGSGYTFLGDAVCTMDQINPQIASRLATPLTRWKRYDPARQNLIRNVLQDISGRDNLSKDVFEIVTKGLQQD